MKDLDWTDVPDIQDKLIELIERELKRKQMSQADLGEIVGMTRVNVNKSLRKTHRGMTIDQLVRLANGVGLDVDVVVKIQKGKK